MHNLAVLVGAQFFAAWGQVCMVVLAGIVGAELAPRAGLATLPVACAVLGVAAATVPAALAMQCWGRRPVLIGGMLLAGTGSLLAAAAIQVQSFWLFCSATAVIGSNLACTAQYRFAAAESVAPGRVSRAVAWVMLGTVGAAVVAPQLVVAVRHWAGAEYSGSFLLLSLAYAAGSACLLGLREAPQSADGPREQGRPLLPILRQPAFLIALLAAATGYGVMALLMTATPLSMHVVDGYSVEATALVIQAHVLSMYLPSLVSGWLVARLGAWRMIAAGALLELACTGLAVAGQGLAHYSLALVALGTGWNFLFVAGTTLLTRSYRSEERFRVQAVNEFGIFGITAGASLLAGALIAALGWQGLNRLAAAPLLLLLAVTLLGRRHAR